MVIMPHIYTGRIIRLIELNSHREYHSAVLLAPELGGSVGPFIIWDSSLKLIFSPHIISEFLS